MNNKPDNVMQSWFWYAVGAAVMYGLHQVFTKMAADKIGDGVGGFVVEGSAAVTIGVYLIFLWTTRRWIQPVSAPGVFFSVLTGLCVGVGTILFFVLFQKGGPLSVLPMILAAGAALMAIAGIAFFKEPVSWQRLLGIALSIAGLVLMKYSKS